MEEGTLDSEGTIFTSESPGVESNTQANKKLKSSSKRPVKNLHALDNPQLDPKEAEEAQAKLEKIVHASHRIIFQCKSVFPFDFFPDEIIIDLNKIDINRGLFFFTKQRISIPFKTVIGVTGINDLFFGSVVVETTGVEQTHVQVTKLWKNDAIKARRMIAGVLAAMTDNIDLAQLQPDYVERMVEEVGKSVPR